jgi:hypothetical protein
MKWLSPKQCAQLIADYYPATPFQVRSWCETGMIPSPYARRNPNLLERGHWRISVKGLESILKNLLNLSDSEMHELRRKILS